MLQKGSPCIVEQLGGGFDGCAYMLILGTIFAPVKQLYCIIRSQFDFFFFFVRERKIILALLLYLFMTITMCPSQHFCSGRNIVTIDRLAQWQVGITTTRYTTSKDNAEKEDCRPDENTPTAKSFLKDRVYPLDGRLSWPYIPVPPEKQGNIKPITWLGRLKEPQLFGQQMLKAQIDILACLFLYNNWGSLSTCIMLPDSSR